MHHAPLSSAPECATVQVYLLVEPCPPGQPIHVYREGSVTLLFLDPEATRVDISWAVRDDLTRCEIEVVRAGYSLDPQTDEVPAHILGPYGAKCDRRIPAPLRFPTAAVLSHRRRLSDLLTASA